MNSNFMYSSSKDDDKVLTLRHLLEYIDIQGRMSETSSAKVIATTVETIFTRPLSGAVRLAKENNLYAGTLKGI